MKKRTDRIFMAGLLAVAALFMGCGQTEEFIDTGGGQIKLRTVTMFGGIDSNAVVYEEIREEFEKENPDIYVEDESRTSDEQWKAQIAADFAAGNEPDVLQFFTDATANQLVATNKFVTVDEIREEYPEYAKDTYGWALEQVSNSDGVSRAVPTTGFWEGMYCNKDVFERYHVPLPTDWESLVFAVNEFKKHGIVPISCSLSAVPHYWMEYFLLCSSGTEKYINEGKTVPEEWIHGLELFQTLREMGAFPENTDSIDNSYAYELFNNKSAAMILEGNWFLPTVTDQENTVVIPFPGIEGQKVNNEIIIGGMTTGFYITRRAWNDPKKRDAAVRYVMMQTNREAVQKYWENGGGTAIAATEVTSMSDRTRLAEYAWNCMGSAKKRILPTDSRMDPEAYKILIAGIVNVSDGGSAEDLLNTVFRIENERS